MQLRDKCVTSPSSPPIVLCPAAAELAIRPLQSTHLHGTAPNDGQSSRRMPGLPLATETISSRSRTAAQRISLSR